MQRQQGTINAEIFEHAPTGYFILRSSDNVILEANLTAKELLQEDPETIHKKEFNKYIAPEYTDTFNFHVKKALKSSNRETCEIKVFRRDGAFWALLEIITIHEKQHLYVAMVDITQQKDVLARIEMKVRESIKKNRELTSQLLLVQAEERRKIALEIHDTIGQSLTLLTMQLYQLRKLASREIGPILDEIESQIRDITRQIQHLSSSLSMHMLGDVGLLSALHDYFRKVQDSARLKINFSYQVEQRLPRIVETALFLIIREAIINVVKHANTNEVDISLRSDNNVLNLRIEDRGAGFNLDSVNLNSTGMRGMQERAEILGGRWTVASSPGKGTRLTGEFPLPR